MTMDIETGRGTDGSPLLGEPLYISWCINGKGYGLPAFDLTEWLLEHFLTYAKDGWILYVHNGWRFDYQRINWEMVADYGFDVQFLTAKDGQVKSATVTKDEFTWYLRDSVLLIPMKLSKLTAAFSPDTPKFKRKLGFDEYPFNPFDMDDVDYAIVDSVALYHAISNVDKILVEKFSVSLHEASTLPGIAYRAFRLMFRRPNKKEGIDGEYYPGISYQLLHAAEESYQGGQTIAFRTTPTYDVVSYDANSMYVWVMLNFPLPTGEARHFYGPPPIWEPETTLCMAVVHIPKGVFPLLKTKDANNKKGNFRGVVSGWYWLFELEEQRKLGATYEIIESYQWEERTECAKRYAEKCRDLRFEDYFGPLGIIAKLLGNALYGKFAQTIVDYLITMKKEPYEDDVPVYSPSTKSVVKNLYYSKSAPSFRAQMTHWSSYITAHARVRLNEAITAIGYDHVLYCDTDSVFFERKYTNRMKHLIGSEYGQFKLEKGESHRGVYFHAVAPKAYKVVAGKDNVIKNKGIPSGSLTKQGGYFYLGKHRKKIKYVQTKSLIVKLKQQNGYGAETFRQIAATDSTTNGKSEEGKWVPDVAEMRTLNQIRGVEKSPSYLMAYYSNIMTAWKGRE